MGSNKKWLKQRGYNNSFFILTITLNKAAPETVYPIGPVNSTQCDEQQQYLVFFALGLYFPQVVSPWFPVVTCRPSLCAEANTAPHLCVHAHQLCFRTDVDSV